jgi:hypothetical protein
MGAGRSPSSGVVGISRLAVPSPARGCHRCTRGWAGGLSSPAAERLVAAGVELATDRLAGAGLLPTTALPDYPSWRRALVGKSGGSHARLVVLLITLSLSLES